MIPVQGGGGGGERVLVWVRGEPYFVAAAPGVGIVGLGEGKG